jgi:beta-carotene ketolase (CrtW type)
VRGEPPLDRPLNSSDRVAQAGPWIALGIIALWAASLLTLVLVPAASATAARAAAGIALQTFLFTGLFVTAHDALHGSVAPRRPRLNDAIGALCTFCYAMFPFRPLRAAHHRHHAHPASADDPDFHDGRHRGFFRWYGHFFVSYFNWKQVVGMAIAYNLLQHGLGLPAPRLIGFWVVPSLLSTLQLFYFGTYLPHRERPEGYADSHRARSNDLSPVLSFLACYHFGYHWWHHEHPSAPWWQLPRLRRSARSSACAPSELASSQ